MGVPQVEGNPFEPWDRLLDDKSFSEEAQSSNGFTTLRVGLQNFC